MGFKAVRDNNRQEQIDVERFCNRWRKVLFFKDYLALLSQTIVDDTDTQQFEVSPNGTLVEVARTPHGELVRRELSPDEHPSHDGRTIQVTHSTSDGPAQTLYSDAPLEPEVAYDLLLELNQLIHHHVRGRGTLTRIDDWLARMRPNADWVAQKAALKIIDLLKDGSESITRLLSGKD